MCEIIVATSVYGGMRDLQGHNIHGDDVNMDLTISHNKREEESYIILNLSIHTYTYTLHLQATTYTSKEC